ncbi:MAG: enoyl-CoA hydratase/isomerase family protein, partial [Gemmatimonadetes bacterium]|nr:enoyl-CoA hydratase/isomerase family protein [Gemmatimonadota bacterium]
MSYQTLLLERQGHVVRLRLNRPDKRNAQSLEMWRELKAVGVALEDDPEVRVVVVSGEGHSFSAGIDL